MRKSFLVVGLGRFGMSTARMLTALGHEVLAVDKDAELVAAIKDDVLHAIQADTSDERVIRSLGIRNFDAVAICIGDDVRASVLTTILCREAGAKKIIAKAQDDLHQKLLLKTGADRVVQPEHDGGVRLARTLADEGVLDSLDLSEEYSINEISVPKAWISHSLAELNVRKKFGVSVLAIRREGQIIINIDPDAPLRSGDAIYVLGENRRLDKLQ